MSAREQFLIDILLAGEDYLGLGTSLPILTKARGFPDGQKDARRCAERLQHAVTLHLFHYQLH
jgi:hypothetical protein